MSMMDDSNPLLKARPPETDYLTYLTILEYNLSKEQLPTLHHVLQDTTLTANIGWDLVHLLLPLLPESEECIRDVVRLGNPREVVLKVTELLEGIAVEEEGLESEDSEGDVDQVESESEHDVEQSTNDGPAASMSEQPLVVDKTAPVPAPAHPSKDVRFSSLLSMLIVLHPRIKTKYPSRFFSTSLQAILSAYTTLAESAVATESVLNFVKQVLGAQRPSLPPRKSSSAVHKIQAAQDTQSCAPDPEASSDGLALGELDLQRRLLQSFLTYVAEVYFSSLRDADQDAPGVSWAARYQELVSPQKQVPGRQSKTELYAGDETFHQRDAFTGQILALSRDLKLQRDELVAALLKASDPQDDLDGAKDDDKDTGLPSHSSEVPLSTTGSLYILVGSLASPLLFHTPDISTVNLPSYSTLLSSMLPLPTFPSLATTSPPILDALFFLGFYIQDTQPPYSAPTDELTLTLQRLSLLSANLASPSQRYQAHQLASQILHAHPSDDVKLGQIRDTLEHCPYDSLKASAVEWLKTEILSANTSPSDTSNPNDAPAEKSIFASPALLHILGDFLWTDVAVSKEHTPDEYAQFQNLQPFYLAVLNLLFLTLSNKAIRENLDILDFQSDIATNFLTPLLEVANQFESALLIEDTKELREEDAGVREARLAECRLLMMNCMQVLAKF